MKTLTNWINIVSVALMVLGLIHLAATPMVLEMIQIEANDQESVFLFMYLAAGIGTILPGLISKLQIAILKEQNKRAWISIFICAIYTVILGIGAVVFMLDNPFAYITLLLGLLLLIPTFLIKRQL